MSQLRFAVGPWNVHEGEDAFGPAVRKSIDFASKVARFKEIGFSAVEFHDDDAVPELDTLSYSQIISRAKETKQILDDHGLVAELVAPRLWTDRRTVDGAFTSNSVSDREYALQRAYRTIDIANVMGADKTVLWLAREGTLCFESKCPVDGVKRVIDAINKILEYDKNIKVLIEPKPNEPIDRSFVPTMGHVMAVASATVDPSRVGGLLESAHAVLAGLDPANEIAFALSFGKLWGVHLNDQNGLKYDQDKTFGVENLRQAFNQIKVLVENNYGSKGEYVGLDVKAMRTQPDGFSFNHLSNSIKITRMLEEKVKKFDYTFHKQCIDNRDYESLEMYVVELLMNG